MINNQIAKSLICTSVTTVLNLSSETMWICTEAKVRIKEKWKGKQGTVVSTELMYSHFWLPSGHMTALALSLWLINQSKRFAETQNNYPHINVMCQHLCFMTEDKGTFLFICCVFWQRLVVITRDLLLLNDISVCLN